MSNDVRLQTNLTQIPIKEELEETQDNYETVSRRYWQKPLKN